MRVRGHSHGAVTMEPISYRQEVFRKLVHLSSFWMVVLIALTGRYRWMVAAAFGTAWVLNLLTEHAVARKIPYITPLYRFFFGKMLRDEPHPEQWVISGSPPVFLAAALVTACFPTCAAATALAIMLASDTAAALIGRRFGKIRFANGKSFEGTAAFCLAGWLCCGISAPICGGNGRYFLCGAAGVVFAALAELYEKKLHCDDNLSIPLIAGVFLTAGAYGGGIC